MRTASSACSRLTAGFFGFFIGVSAKSRREV
jgi:hypothetical protein